MQSSNFPLLRPALLLTVAAFTLAPLRAADAVKPTDDKEPLPTFENYITLAGQFSSVKGNEAAYQANTGNAKGGFGGVEDFQYERALKNDIAILIDGHAILGNSDYLAHVKLTKTDFGSFDAGIKQYRTYYDNAGGFFLPTENAWAGLLTSQEAMYIDRTKIWAEASLTLPNLPVFTLRYTNENRRGNKDSTVWGATDYTGLPTSATAATLASRYLAPAYLQVSERQQLLEAIMQHTIGSTSFSLNLQGSRTDLLNTHFFDRYPGQVAMPSFATSGNRRNLNNQVSGYQQRGNEADTYGIIAKVETALSESVKVYTGLRYQKADVDFTEERPLNTTATYGTGPVGYVILPSANIKGLTGTSEVETLIANIGAEVKVGHGLFADIVLKGEKRTIETSDRYQTQTSAVSAGGVITINAPANMAAASSLDEKALIPELSLRYTGIRNLTLYGTIEARNLTGDERVYTPYNTVTVTNPAFTDTDVSEAHYNYTVGANWNPLSKLTVRGELFYKDHQNDFQNAPTSAASLFSLGYDFKGVKGSVVITPIAPISFTTRYVYQQGKSTTQTFTRLEYQAGDVAIHQIGETVNWTPMKQFYMQADLNVVFDTTSTSYPRAGGGANTVVRDANNNYLNGSVLAGFVVDKVTNAEIQYTYYNADNYEPALMATTVPYGTTQTDHTITVAVKRKITAKLVAELKLGYIESKNDNSGGHTDFHSPLAYVSLQQGF